MKKYKVLITDILNNSSEHLTAEEIFFRAKTFEPKISLATVYNNLNTMYNNKEIRKICVHDQVDRYDKTFHLHGHLICEKCGCVSDFSTEDFIPYLENKLSVDVGTYDLNVYYICDKCRQGFTK